MAKKKAEKPKREPTKYQLSRWQKQQKRQRLVLIAGISVVAAVAGVIGGGWYANEYQPLQETVIRVNDTEFSMKYYIDILRLNYKYGVTGDVLGFIEQNELIMQGAEDLGITVSASEVDEELQSYDPPLGKDYAELARASVLAEKLLDERFEHEVPLSAEQRHTMAMFLESEGQANEVRARLEDGEDFGELAGELSLDTSSKAVNGDFGWYPRDILPALLGTSVVEDYAFTSDVGVLSLPLYDEAKVKSVGYWIVEVMEIDEEEEDRVKVRAMLLGSEQEAQETIARLEDGEDFGELAEELSQDAASKAKGGDLGWLTPAKVASILEDFVFNSEEGTLSKPIRDDGLRTEGGYWLVKVVDRDDDRKIGDGDRDFLKRNALDEWVASLWDNPENEVEDYLDSAKMSWARERAMAGITK